MQLMLPMALGPGPVDGIAQPLDHGVLQRTCELALDLHARQFAPFGRGLDLLRRRLAWLLLRASGEGAGDGCQRGNGKAEHESAIGAGHGSGF